MHLTRLALTDFRSYAELSLELSPGVTTFSGPNGEGKTNLVEAIGYLATLGSHRVATDAPLIRQGAERAVVRAAVTSVNGSALIEVELNPGRANRVRLNRTPLPRPRDILGTLRTVLFAPEDLALVKGDPGDRRRFLDDLLVATAPRRTENVCSVVSSNGLATCTSRASPSLPPSRMSPPQSTTNASYPLSSDASSSANTPFAIPPGSIRTVGGRVTVPARRSVDTRRQFAADAGAPGARSGASASATPSGRPSPAKCES